MQTIGNTHTQKLNLKLKSMHITKQVGDIPESFEALKSVVKATMCG